MLNQIIIKLSGYPAALSLAFQLCIHSILIAIMREQYTENKIISLRSVICQTLFYNQF